MSELFHTGLPFKNGEVAGVRKWDGLRENGAERSEGPCAASFLRLMRLEYALSAGVYLEGELGGRRRKVKWNAGVRTWCWGTDREGHRTTSSRLSVLPFPEVTTIGKCQMGSVSPLNTFNLLSCSCPVLGEFQMKYPLKASVFLR